MADKPLSTFRVWLERKDDRTSWPFDVRADSATKDDGLFQLARTEAKRQMLSVTGWRFDRADLIR
jgi:hypothetical protein